MSIPQADSDSVDNFVVITQALGILHLVQKGMNFGAKFDVEGKPHVLAMIGKMLSPASLDAAADILKHAATDPKTRQRMLEMGFWGAWWKALA